MAQTLVEAGADVNAVRADINWKGTGSRQRAFDMLLQSPLGRNPGLLESFLTHGADPNAKDVRSVHSMRTDGQVVRVPLHSAVQHGDVHAAAVLLRAGARRCQ